YQLSDIVESGVGLFEYLDDPIGHRVFGDPRGIAQFAENQIGGTLVIGHVLLFDALVNGGFDGSAEARAHIDAVGPEGEGGHQAAPVSDPAAGDHGDGYPAGCGRNQHEPGDIVLARMTGTLEAVDGDGVDT